MKHRGTTAYRLGGCHFQCESDALTGDSHTEALVGRNGSIDLLSNPRFDSGAWFAALLGKPEHGIVPTAEAGVTPRRLKIEWARLDSNQGPRDYESKLNP